MTRVAALVALVAAIGAVTLLDRLDLVRPRWTGQEGVRYLDLVRHARPVLLGYDALAADVVWLQAIQFIADQVSRKGDMSGLFPFLDAATELDPKYRHVYHLGGTALVSLGRRPDEAVRLLEKGYRALPDDWHSPYLMAYTYLFYYQDYGTAARYLEEAARRVGRPTYMTALAARLYVQAGSPEVALSFLESMRRQAVDPVVRHQIEERMREVVVDRDLRAIEAAVARYRERRGRAPETVDELVRAGLLAARPIEPFGGTYRIDPASGAVSSSSGKGRLLVYQPPAAPEPLGERR